MLLLLAESVAPYESERTRQRGANLCEDKEREHEIHRHLLQFSTCKKRMRITDIQEDNAFYSFLSLFSFFFILIILSPVSLSHVSPKKIFATHTHSSRQGVS